MPKVRATTTVTIVQEWPFDEDHYPGSESLSEALEHERNLDDVDVITAFVESIDTDHGFELTNVVVALDDAGNVLDDQTVAIMNDPPVSPLTDQ